MNGDGQLRDHPRIAMERAITDHAAGAVIQVHAGRENSLSIPDSPRSSAAISQPHWRDRQPPAAGIQGQYCRPISRIDGSTVKPLRNRCTIGRPRDRPSTSSGERAHGANIGDQLLELLDALEISCEQDHSADQRMGQQPAILPGSGSCPAVHHHRAERHRDV